MTPEEYCYQKVAKFGSEYYFSGRGLSNLKRDGVCAVAAFYQEIEDITLNTEDFAIASAKLNWWRDQVVTIRDGKPNHPVALAIQKIPDFNSLRLIEIIEGLEQNLAPTKFITFEDLVIHIMRTAGIRELCFKDILKIDDEIITPEIIYQLALVIEFVYYIQNLRRFLRRQLILFPQNELQQFAIKDTDFYAFKTTKNIYDLLLFQTEKIERAYEKVKKEITPSNSPTIKFFIKRCNIAMAVLKAIKNSNFQVLESYIDITPLKSWWIAWRS